MKDLQLQLPKGTDPKFQKIAESLRMAIRKGLAKPGERVPSTRDLGRKFQVHRHTVMAALDELVAEGWLIAHPKKGFEVCPVLPTEMFQVATPPKTLSEKKFNWRIVRNPVNPWPERQNERSYLFRFQSGLADLRLFPVDEFRSFVSDSLKNAKVKDLAFGEPSGDPKLIEALSSFLRRTRSLTDRDILVTHGSQEGIYLTAQLLLKPGDKVAVEGLGYPPAWDAFRSAGASLASIPLEKDGINLDALEEAIKKGSIRLIYVTPLHQYPTTATLPVAKRIKLYKLATQHKIPILEDDYDHEFHYRCEPLPPLASEDPEGLVIYISTFTKVLFPSSRLGFMSVPKNLLEPLSNLKRNVSRQTNFLMQDSVARWMESGGMERHLRRMRRVYEERLGTLEGILTEAKNRGVALDFTVPDGGMALWLTTQIPALKLQKLLADKGVYVTPGDTYTLSKTQSFSLRLGFANLAAKELTQATKILLSVIEKNY